MRGATFTSSGLVSAGIFQSTRPMRGATQEVLNGFEEDVYFNPRAPCGARRKIIDSIIMQSEFQSTRPMRGATYGTTRPRWTVWNFNPRAPCGARQYVAGNGDVIAVFQSTRPMRGATGAILHISRSPAVFQSTRPMRGATMSNRSAPRRKCISIHAPHAGRDRDKL